MLRKLPPQLLAICSSLPLIVPAVLAVSSAVTMFFLVTGRFYTWQILLTGGAVALITAVYMYKISQHLSRPGSAFERSLCDLLVLVIIVAWAAINIPLTSQHVFVDRDPGIYAVTGQWLTEHSNLHISSPQSLKELPGLTFNSHGFGLSTKTPGELFAQGSHLLPALLGVVGRLAGTHAMLHVNALIGAIALLSVYGFARLIMLPRWALISMLSLAVALPVIYFSRDTYTEPLSMALTFGALSAIWVAMKSNRLGMWLLAGVILGAGVLTRIDAYLTIAAILLFLIIYMALAQKGERLSRTYRTAALLTGTVLAALIGWADVFYLSSGYYDSQWPELKKEFMLLAALTGLSFVAIFFSWKTKTLNWLDRKTSRWRRKVFAAIILLFFAILASRPYWYVGHTVTTATVDGKPALIPSYSEHTLDWVRWYLGPVMLLSGVGGLAFAAARAAKDKSLILLPALGVILLTSSLYLILPNIFPDQIWASRRLVPVILPGMAIFGGLLLQELYRAKDVLLFGEPLNLKIVTTVFATLAIAGPLFVSGPFLKVRTYTPELGQVEAVCKSLPKNSVVLWVGAVQQNAIQSTRAFCGHDSAGITAGTSLPQYLKKLETGADADNPQKIIIGVYGAQRDLLPDEEAKNLIDVGAISYRSLQSTTTMYPRFTVTNTQTILLGEVTKDGVKPVEIQ